VLIFLRHGRTANNAAARLQGETDAPLDEVGRAQAVRAGEYIRDRWDIQAVISTSRIRCRETADLAGFDPNIHVIDDRWREIDFGEFEGQRVGDVVPDLGERWRDDIDYQPIGGESLGSLHARVADACVEFADRARTENLLVVSHATPIKSAVIWATGGGPSMILNLWVTPGSVSVLDQVSGHTVLAEFNRRFDSE
jgi:alpha-ribazole phosphatase